MIIINKSGILKYKSLRFKCALGKAGIKKKIKEGDNVTPRGLYRILKIFYRADRVKINNANFKKIEITKKIGWCDDTNSKYYNRVINLPSSLSHEPLYRKDNLYDIV